MEEGREKRKKTSREGSLDTCKNERDHNEGREKQERHSEKEGRKETETRRKSEICKEERNRTKREKWVRERE